MPDAFHPLLERPNTEVSLRRLDNFDVMRLFRLIREDRLLPYLVGGAIFLAAITLRLELDSLPPAVAFVTFFPAIVLIAVTGGWRIAAAGTVLSALTIWWLLFRLADAPPPARSTELLAIGVFIVSGAVIIGIVEALAGLAWPVAATARADAASAGIAGQPPTKAGAFMRAVEAILDQAGTDGDDANSAAAARAHIGLLRIVADDVDDCDIDGRNWPDRLQAICDHILRARELRGTRIRVDAAGDGIPPHRRAMLSIIIAELLPATAAEAPAQALEISVRDIGERRRALEIGGSSPALAPLLDPARAGTPRGRVLRVMTQSLGATVTYSRDPVFLVRVVFCV